MRTVTRRWWRAAGVVLAGGGAAVFGPGPAATAQPPSPPATKFDPMWTRSASPLNPIALPITGPVTPAAAVLPAAQPPAPPPLPAVPTLPSAPVLPPPPAGVVPPPAVTTPALPPLPGLPAPAAQPPVAPAAQPPLPALPVTPPAPPAKSVLPAQPAAPAKAESPLRQVDNGNSVKTDAAWAPPRAVAPPPREVVVPTEPAVAARVARVVDRPKPPEVPVPPSERDVFPLPPPTPVPVAGVPAPPMPMIPVVPLPAPPMNPVATNPTATTPGADPMTFKSTAAAALLGGALAMPPVKADAPSGGTAETQTKDTPKTTDEKLTEIQRTLTRLTDLIDGRKDDKGYPLPSDPGLVDEVRRLRNEVASLKTQLDQLKNSTSLRPTTGGTVPGIPTPMPGAGGGPAGPKGTVQVVNEYPIEITMVVNNRSYRVPASQSMNIPVTPGDFSYQLISGNTALAPTRSTIRDGEVVTLRIK